MSGWIQAFWVPDRSDRRRQRRGAGGSIAIWLAVSQIAASSAEALRTVRLRESTASRVAAAGSDDLQVRFSYRAFAPSRLRLYRGTNYQELVTVGEYAIPPGSGNASFADAGRRDEARIYQVRLVDAQGVEKVLGTIIWEPPQLAGQSGAASESLHPSLAVLPATTESEPLTIGPVARMEGALGRPQSRKPLVPPPKLSAG